MSFGQPPSNQNGLKYTGDQISDVPCVNFPRAPTANDRAYPLLTMWRNSNKAAVLPDQEGDIWYLSKFTPNGTNPVLAAWVKIGIQNPSTTTFVTNSGSATPVGGVLNVVGTGTTNTIGSGNTITVNSTGAMATLNELTVDIATGTGANPILPIGGNITINGAQVAAGTTANVIRTDTTALGSFRVEVQRSQAVASTTVGDNGVSHFNSKNFTVDGNGFVSLNPSSGYWYVNSDIPNVTGDGTKYVIIYDTNRYLNGADISYNSGTGIFTVNTAGVYVICWSIGFYNIFSTAYNSSEVYLRFGNGGPTFFDNPGAHSENFFGQVDYNGSAVMSLAAGSTFSGRASCQTSAKTIGVKGNQGAPDFNDHTFVSFVRIT